MRCSAAAPQPPALVLDDFYAIHAPDVHNAIDSLTCHCPPPLRLILPTREDLPSSLPRLRAQGLMNEVRADDLRFQPIGPDLDPAMVRMWESRTEGWITGL